MKPGIHYRAILAAVALAGSLAACSAPDTAPSNESSAITPAALPGAIDNDTATPVGGQSTPAPTHSASSSTDGPLACSADIGATKAQQLVDQCINVSPATHPPCNAANSCAMIEAEIARGCALLDEDAEKAGCTPIRSAEAAQDAIRRYYSAINAQDYATAYATWSSNGEASGKSYEAFASGFARTRHTAVMFGNPGEVEGAAGSVYIELPVTIDAQLDDGTHQKFTGSYTLRQVNGPNGPGPSQGWHIASAKLKAA
ncbi:hypothetical protein [Sphingosinithalassobacter portus]|uniref:hypothetical protein n=1 Tax=Stakelama portus TaxID=2676234 RepID=UPI000D6EADDF|nr:hypothetical protein [Sphingosinithalassobacter portus]